MSFSWVCSSPRCPKQVTFFLTYDLKNKTKHLQVNNKYEEKTRYYYSEVKIGELFKKKK